MHSVGCATSAYLDCVCVCVRACVRARVCVCVCVCTVLTQSCMLHVSSCVVVHLLSIHVFVLFFLYTLGHDPSILYPIDMAVHQVHKSYLVNSIFVAILV